MNAGGVEVEVVLEYTNGQVSTTGNKQSSGNCLRIHLEETIQYASTLQATLRGYTLIKWTQANLMSFVANWTSCTDLADFGRPQVHTERVASS